MNTAAKEKRDFHLQGKVAYQKLQTSQLTIKVRLMVKFNSHQQRAEEVIAMTVIPVLYENHLLH